MTPRNRFMLATALATGLLVAMPLAFSQKAPESATVPTDPGFKPGTGQINPGSEHQAPSYSDQNIPIPAPEEARAAMLEPVSKDPSLGPPPDGGQQQAAAGGAATTGQGAGGAATTGKGDGGGAGPQGNSSPSSNGGGGPTGQGESITGGPTPQQSGAEPRSSTAPNPGPTAANGTSPTGPIGSVGETIPAKQSHRNDVLDRVPIMAWPQPLSDEQRQRIFKEAMADKAQAAADADTLMPASELSTDQALNSMHPLPQSLGDIEGVKKLKYVKGKNTVLLVEPSTRTVVEQIKS